MRATTTFICRSSASADARSSRLASRTIRDAVRAAITGPVRIVGSAARHVAAAWPKGAEPPLQVEHRSAPDIDWVARLGAAAAEGYGRRSRFICARPTRSRRMRHACPADDLLVTRLFTRGEPTLSEAVAAGRRALAALHAARSIGDGAMGSSSICCSTAMSSRIARWWTQPVGFILSRRVLEEAEILSVAVAARAAARDWRANCSICICAVLRDSAHARCFLEVDEGNQPARRLYRRAGFREVGRRSGYYPPARVPPR
jgi:ribosomal-protein-alanine N-acetyltransferase